MFGAPKRTTTELAEAVLPRLADSLFAQVREVGRTIRPLTSTGVTTTWTGKQPSERLNEPPDLETDVYERLRVLLRLSGFHDGCFRAELAGQLSRHATIRACMAL